MLPIVAQGIGIVGMALQIGSFQCKTVKKLYLAQGIAATLTAVHYLMIGALSGMAMNLVGLLRCFCLGQKNPKFHSKWVMSGILLFNALLAFLTLPEEGAIGLLPIIAQLIGTLSLWTRSNLVIHLVQLLLLSPAWTVYAAISGSFPGVQNEIFTVISIIVYFITAHRGKQNHRSTP